MPLRHAIPNISIGTDIIRTSRLAHYLYTHPIDNGLSTNGLQQRQNANNALRRSSKLDHFLRKVFSPRERKGISIPSRVLMPFPSELAVEKSYVNMNAEQKKVLQFLASRYVILMSFINPIISQFSFSSFLSPS